MSAGDDLASVLDRSQFTPRLPLAIVGVVGCLLIGVGWLLLQGSDIPFTHPASLPVFPPAIIQPFQKVAIATTSALLNINTASADELDTLPGIGSMRAQQILTHQPYADYEDFVNRSGLSKNLCEKIYPYVHW
jgi:hypothetical protein